MQVRVKQIIQETALVRRLILETATGTAFHFQPGQFVAIRFAELPEGSNERSYSIASVPNGSGEFEICVVINPTGAGTPILWQKAVGDMLEVSEPKGLFVLPADLDHEICFICTGTGVAPFRSMVLWLLEHQNYQKQIHLIFGNRQESDIIYRAEFETLQHTFPNFHFYPVLSRETAPGMAHGYVHEVYERIFSDHREGRFFVCGWNAMCSEARHRLKAMGYNRRQYFFEDYG